MALPRSPLYGPDEDGMVKDADEVVDASQLPPG
jgi:acetolactate synthase-1/3 small subunit